MAENTTNDATSTPICANCNKTGAVRAGLLQCGSCHEVKYCSRACQRADWKHHKTTCTFVPTGKKATGDDSQQSGHFVTTLGVDPHLARGMPQSQLESMKALLWGGKNDFLHGKGENETYDLIVDSHRMRIEDDYTFRGELAGLYAGKDPVPGFEKYLTKMEKKEGVLPPWWNAEKRKACIARGNDKDPWSSLHFAVEKSDIQEHYNNPQMPMQLRMLAEDVIGTNVMTG